METLFAKIIPFAFVIVALYMLIFETDPKPGRKHKHYE